MKVHHEIKSQSFDEARPENSRELFRSECETNLSCSNIGVRVRGVRVGGRSISVFFLLSYTLYMIYIKTHIARQRYKIWQIYIKNMADLLNVIIFSRLLTYFWNSIAKLDQDTVYHSFF
jgi:hypothetical protein